LRALRTAIVLGTRPEIIKMAPIIRAFRKSHADFFVLHTGQHYSRNMDRVFFENLRLGTPEFNLEVGSGSHAEETAAMLTGTERILSNEKVTGVLVEGDTNSVLAGALAAAKLRIRVGHVEAGLRSFDRSMPEELNRIIADHLADVLYAPTGVARTNLIHEGVQNSRIHVTGNTIVDSVRQNLEMARKVDTNSLLEGMGSEYVLSTIHRQENVDTPSRLRGIVKGLESVARSTGMKVLYPAHPRAMKRMKEFGVKPAKAFVRVVEPLDYLTFLKLESKASLVLTDSGGVQEEACILGVPCVTLRENTERPETVQVGANLVAGVAPRGILRAAKTMSGKKGWKNPFGDGRAGARIVRSWMSSSG
jgi:UDP-N-acetylglucosamine 2-epimerase (non-hydrolysing)